MNTKYDLDLGPIYHEDLEDWAERKLTQAQADEVFEQIREQVCDAVSDICRDAIYDIVSEVCEGEPEEAGEPAEETEEAREKRLGVEAEQDRLAAEYEVARKVYGVAAKEAQTSAAALAHASARAAAMQAFEAANAAARAALEASPEQVAMKHYFAKLQQTGDALRAFQTANAAWLPKSK
jgi:hypothetical protein